MRISGHTPLSQVVREELPAEQLAMFASLWVESVEEATSLIAAAGETKIEGDVLDSMRRTMAAILVNVPGSHLAKWKSTNFNGALGFSVNPEAIDFYREYGRVVSHASTAFEISGAPLPPSVRLMDRIPPVRSQGGRGTCVAFSVAALREYLEDGDTNLSEQFLYWACKKLDGRGDMPGTTIHTAMSALSTQGLCAHGDWPYNPEKIEGNESQDPPPTNAREQATKFRMRHAVPVAVNNINHYKQILADGDGVAGMPVAFATFVFDSWLRSAATNQTGKITMPLPGEHPTGAHAMLVAGYQDDPSVPGGGYFIVRNSWGEGWATQSPEAPGHAMMPYAYVEQCALEAFSGEDMASVNWIPPSAIQETPDNPHVFMLDGDMRDINGKLIRKGKRVIQDPDSLDKIVEYTPRNMAAFKKRDNCL